jgi:hypothetical protein
MNRNEEYNELLTEMENTPNELEYTVKRAQVRLKNRSRIKFVTVTLSSFASFLMVFTILVNSFPTIAYACGQIPMLKDLAQLVSFSPSLSAAVENEYVQPIELEQTEADITARIEYIIVDQKQLDVFYSLDSKIYSAMEVNPQIKSRYGKILSGYTLSSGSFGALNSELRHLTVNYVDENMPNSLQLILKIHDNGNHEMTEELVLYEDQKPNKDEFIEPEYKEPEYIAEFTFLLEFDPYFTAQGETITLNQTFELDGQSLSVTTVDIYPTHISINLDDIDSNTAWLQSINFYIENEKGERFDRISNGITATGDKDSPMMVSHRLESSFFSNSENLTLFITGVTWLDKDMEKVKIDLKNVTADTLPQYVEFENATRRDNNWTLEFLAKEFKENMSYQLWRTDYYDEQGKEYSYNSWSTGVTDSYNEEIGQNKPEQFEVKFTLYNYPYDIVYLKPNYSRIVELPSPIEIKVK